MQLMFNICHCSSILKAWCPLDLSITGDTSSTYQAVFGNFVFQKMGIYSLNGTLVKVGIDGVDYKHPPKLIYSMFIKKKCTKPSEAIIMWLNKGEPWTNSFVFQTAPFEFVKCLYTDILPIEIKLYLIS